LAVIIANLLENAAEYSDESGRIVVDAVALNETVELTLTNLGCTLTDQQLECGFERFWRADTSRSNVHRHVGLGLALVRRLATCLEGRAWAETRDGNFTVRLQLPGSERAVD
jgi:two-component system sensor histidine kinase BaeS